ncbi:hypothetical protein LINPERHAP1_LOCUS31922, partial [Linum perenne]
ADNKTHFFLPKTLTRRRTFLVDRQRTLKQFARRRWTSTLLCRRPVREARAAPDLRALPRSQSVSRSKSGMPSLFGHGILWWITAQFAGIILWIYALSAKLIRRVPRARSVLLLGVFVTMHSTSTALVVG